MKLRVAAVLPALCLLCLVPGALFAATTPGIEIDGNYLDDDPIDPNEDWFPNHAPDSDPISKEDDTLCGTSPSPKNDITNSYVSNNNEFLYMGMERRANTGQTSFFWAFDIGKDGDNKGDFVFAFCFGSGDSVTDTFVLEYDEVSGEFVRDNTPPAIVFDVNSDRTIAPFGALDRKGRERTFIDKGKFAEASVDLSGIEGFDICNAAAASLEIQTRSSCSLNSQCKDTTGVRDFSFFPLATDLEISQPDPCVPVLVATANAFDGTPPYAYTWFLNGVDITDQDPLWATSDTIVIPLDPEVCGDTEVSVNVADSQCDVDSAQTLAVNQGPEALFANLNVGSCDMTLQFDGTASTDCNTDDTLSFVWDLDGDLIPDSTDPAGAHTYGSCGERAVTMLVADSAGCLSDPIQQPIYVNQPPQAGLRLEGGTCLNLLFAATTVDCDLSQSSTLYTESLDTTLDFGDGTTATTETGTHEYAVCGTYPVTLSTVDASGCTDQIDRSVTIETVFQIN